MTLELSAKPIDATIALSGGVPAAIGECDLIDRARTDPHAFANLYRLHSPAIANYLHRRTGDAHAAEDLLSETFLAAMKSLHRFRHHGTPLRFWLYRLATNAANRWMRTRARQRRRDTVRAINRDAPATAPECEHDLALATHALRRLSPSHQTVLVLHIVEELTIEQIALTLDCRAGTVKSRLFRAREALRHEAHALAADEMPIPRTTKAATP